MLAYALYSGEQQEAGSPVVWVIDHYSDQYAGAGPAYLDDESTYFTSVPDNSITLVRWVIYTAGQGDEGSSGYTPFFSLGLYDSGSVKVHGTEEASTDLHTTFSWQGGDFQDNVCGAILIDSDSPPGAGFPYSWTTVFGPGVASVSCSLGLMSWAKP
jgi:hypothetical protein